MRYILKAVLVVTVTLLCCSGFKQVGQAKILVFDELGRLSDPEDAFYAKNTHLPGIKQLPIPEIDAYDCFGSTKLYEAIAENDAKEVKRLLKAGANPNIVTAHDKTALEIAVHKDYLDMAEILLRKGAMVDLNWPIRKAKSERMRQLLMCYGASPEPPAEKTVNRIMLTCQGEVDSLERTKDAVNASGDFSTISSLSRAVIFNYSPAQMEAVLNAGKNMNDEDEEFGTPLYQAIYQGRSIETLKFVLDKGAAPNLASKGRLPLFMAIEENNTTVVRLLLQAGADPNQREHFRDLPQGTPAIVVAARKQNIEVLRLLILAGADVNAKDEDGCTALYYVLIPYNFSESAARLLLENGASQKVADGRQALDVIGTKAELIDLIMYLSNSNSNSLEGK